MNQANSVLFVSLLLVMLIVTSVVFLLRGETPKIAVTPEKVLIDVPVEIVVSGLKSHEQITLEAACKDKNDNSWRSRAVFQADDKGVVTVATQAPISGSYTGIDSMGLFWSMIPTESGASTDQKVSRFFLQHKNNELEVVLSVFVDNKLKTKKTISRLLVSSNVEKKYMREHGIVGVLFYPKNMSKGPGIIVIPGSGGGIPGTKAQLLASHGYAVLALGYFGEEGLPPTLENIPLEYFQNALHWFKEQPQVDAKRVALVGISRGGELVLLFAATFPQEINAVVASVPSNLVYGDAAPAWTYKNAAIPYMPNSSGEELLVAAKEGKIPFHQGTFEDPREFTSGFLYDMDKFHDAIDAATIPVENIRCPIRIFSGESDKVWPSTLYGKRIMQRLDAKGSTIERKHIQFADAGHWFEFPYTPSIDLPYYHLWEKAWLIMGGTAEGNARASKESWRETLEFLAKTLQK